MKKIIWILIFCIAIAGTARAECWGITITGQDGHPYCVSNQKMNWYAALGWCAAQNRHVPSINEACDYGDQIYGQTVTDCPNIKFNNGVYFDADGNSLHNQVVWTSTTPNCDIWLGPSAHPHCSPTGGRNASFIRALCY